MMMRIKRLQSTVRRGRYIGTALTPHLHKDNQYVVSRTRFAKDYIRVKEEADLPGWVSKGYSVRMSNPAVKSHRGASLIAPESIECK
jgi:hypothetical protein